VSGGAGEQHEQGAGEAHRRIIAKFKAEKQACMIYGNAVYSISPPMGVFMRFLKPGEIQQARIALGMSQAEFAEAFRLNVRTLQDWEIGRREPTGAAAVLLWLIATIPQPILRALKRKEPTGRPPG
jgi:DNA-binding XRE family transcriptional regulator